MINKENPSNFLIVEEDNTNIRQEIDKYLFYWKWFLLGIIVTVLAAYLYLRYTPNTYEVSTTILIDDESNGGLPPELAVFEELGVAGNSKNIENEIGILKSRSLTRKVAENLNLNITLLRKGHVVDNEVYKEEAPIKIALFPKDSSFYNKTINFKVEIVSDTEFRLSKDKNDNFTSHNFGETLQLENVEILVTPRNIEAKDINEIYYVTIRPLVDVVESLRNSIQVNLLNKKASLLVLKLRTRIKSKAEDILDELVRQYNEDAIDNKSLTGKNTDIFINERLKLIEKELKKVDKDAETFKTSNKLTDINTEAGLVLESNSDLEKKIIELNTQLKLVDYVKEHISLNSNDLIPSNLGISAVEINASSDRYNEILLERTRIAKSSGKNNPVLLNLDGQLKQLQASISQGLDNLKSRLSIALSDARTQELRMNTRITAAPKQEREFRDIQRQQQIIETLYLFLLQKREENAISLAVTIPNAQLIDKAQSSKIPVAPKRKMVYAGALLAGLLIPFAIIYLSLLLYNKVNTQKELEAVVKAPFIGDIPKTTQDNKMLVKADRGNMAEAFRMLRTNVNFMLGKTNDVGKNIFITSTVPGEGKTFIAINMATVFAMSNKKVLLIGADIRKPKVAEYLDISSSKKGLTVFLADKDTEIEEIIEPQKWGFDVVQSGIIPPNPSELLMNGRLDELLTYSREHYDYVLIDTAPVNMVTDTLQIASKADLFLYVVRANYLDKRLLDIPQKLYNEKRLPNMAVILNGTESKKGYGYGYGYGYGEENQEKKSWFNKLKG